MKEITLRVPKVAMFGSNADWETYANRSATFPPLWVPRLSTEKVLSVFPIGATSSCFS